MSRLLVVLLIHGYLARVSYSACASIPEGGLRCVCVTQQGTIDLSAIANSDGSPRYVSDRCPSAVALSVTTSTGLKVLLIIKGTATRIIHATSSQNLVALILR